MNHAIILIIIVIILAMLFMQDDNREDFYYYPYGYHPYRWRYPWRYWRHHRKWYPWW